MSWKETTIGEFVRFQRGHDLPEQDRKPGDVPVIGSAGQNGWHNEAKMIGPGVSIGRSGASIGKVTYTSSDYWPHNACLYVTDFLGNDPRFAYYFLKTIDLTALNSGAAQPSLNRNFVHAVSIRVPDSKTEQSKITSLLSAYDDLIENNRRRITLLEEAARLLYREWFVRFHFPGHEHTKFIDGLPEGWEPRTLGDVADIVKTIVKPEDFAEDDVYIGLEHIPRRSFTLADWAPVADLASNKLRFEAGDILFGKIRPYFHKVGFALSAGLTSSDAIVWRVRKPEDWPLVVCATSSDHFVAVASKTVREGSKMPRADDNVLMNYSIPRPIDGMLQVFNDAVRPITGQCKMLALQNQKLAQARDLLLPRLMSGELAV
jgi:type I restriction enzyme S subunit